MRRGRAADARRWIAVEEIFAREGSDAWYSRPAADFVAPGVKCAKCGVASSSSSEEDILDVWFDSGSSQAAVLAARPELKWPADAYLEAVEQARGWFSSSLVCAVSDRGTAPFKSVINHGLTVDEKGRKMSKSLGNSEDAVDAAGRMGADVLRLVYASLDYTSDITLGQTIFTAVVGSRIARFATLAVSCSAISPTSIRRATRSNSTTMLEFDRFILARTEKLKSEVRRAYDAFEFQTAFQADAEFHRRRSELAVYRRRARPALLRRPEITRAALGADRAVPHTRRAGADARAADSVHRRGNLRVYAGRTARQRASD